jgi:hypothetical protein
MKKIVVILLSGILLSWNAGLAKNVQYTVVFKVDSLPAFTLKVDSGSVVEPLNIVKNGYVLEGWFDESDKLYNFSGTVTGDSLRLISKWLKIEDIKTVFLENNKNQDVLKSIKKQANILFIALIALAALLTGLSLYVFLVLNSKKRFRNNILKELENCREGGRMGNYQQSIINKAIEQIEDSNQFQTLDSSKSSDNKTARAIEDLQKRIAKLEDSKRSSSSPEQPAAPAQVQAQPQSLYADSIFAGKFNRVRETPNDDTIFELKLKQAGDTRADVVVYRGAYRKVLANPAYLEGCEKQVLGNSTVTMQREGVAGRDDSGNWIISKKPEVKIS